MGYANTSVAFCQFYYEVLTLRNSEFNQSDNQSLDSYEHSYIFITLFFSRRVIIIKG